MAWAGYCKPVTFELSAFERAAFDAASHREATMAFGLAYEWAVLAWFDALPAEIAGQAEPGG